MKKQIICKGPIIISLIGIIFVILKLTDTINWPWWLVVSPFWSLAIIATVTLLVAGFIILQNVKGRISNMN